MAKSYLAFSKNGELNCGCGIRHVLSSPDGFRDEFTSKPGESDMKCGTANINDPMAVTTIPVPIQRGI